MVAHPLWVRGVAGSNPATRIWLRSPMVEQQTDQLPRPTANAYGSELVKAQIDYFKFFKNYVICVITPIDDSQVCSNCGGSVNSSVGRNSQPHVSDYGKRL